MLCCEFVGIKVIGVCESKLFTSWTVRGSHLEILLSKANWRPLALELIWNDAGEWHRPTHNLKLIRTSYITLQFQGIRGDHQFRMWFSHMFSRSYTVKRANLLEAFSYGQFATLTLLKIKCFGFCIKHNHDKNTIGLFLAKLILMISKLNYNAIY